MELQGANVVVTGGAGGIGRGMAHAFADRGCTIAVVDLDESRAAEAARDVGRGAAGFACDVTDRTSTAAAAAAVEEALGPVHVLCNNAGVGVATPVAPIDLPEWDWVFAVNVGGVVNGLAAFLPGMLEHGEPVHVVNTASEHALGLPFAGVAAYTASKHAVLGLSDAMRRELADRGVGVTVVCPGLVRTGIWRSPERRPDAFGGPGDAPEGLEAMFEPGMDPLEVGRIVADAVEADRFFAMTHPEVRAVAERRHAEVMEAFDALDAR